MQTTYSTDETRLRKEVRAFVARKLPEAIRQRVLRGEHLPAEDYVNWQRILFRRGWAAPTWPAEYGGPGWTPIEQHIFEEECAVGGAPFQLPFGLRMVGPLLIRFGTGEQRQRVLPRIMNADNLWCQGFSEPDAGSDLGSLSTRAIPHAGGYRLSGCKTWITFGPSATHMLCLARTGETQERSRGLSLFMLNLAQPGIERQPIRMADGYAGEICQFFFGAPGSARRFQRVKFPPRQGGRATPPGIESWAHEGNDMS